MGDFIDHLVDEQLSQRPMDLRTCPDCGDNWTAPVNKCDCQDKK